jgi:hypothetical protein
MKQRIVSLVLIVLALFSAAQLTAQVKVSEGGAEELADQLRQQGWHDVAPGVLQRQLPNQIETIAIGKDGLGRAIQELRQRVARAFKAYRKNPSAELKQALGNLKNRLTEMEKAAAALESEQAAAVPPPPGCSYNLGCSTSAFPLADVQGVGADAAAHFGSNCGIESTVYVYTEGYTFDSQEYQNEAETTSPLRPWVSISASVRVPGAPDPACGSAAHAWVTVPSLEIQYSCFKNNTHCPPPPL